jgi:ribosomal protein S18 acetylase RimI-like enzyme
MESSPHIIYRNDVAGIDWSALKAALAADDFDNGRSPEQLRDSFGNSQGVCIAWHKGEIVGTARVLSDSVCNAYLVDVWTKSDFRRRGIAREMVERLVGGLSGQHIYLQADSDIAEFYSKLGFVEQPVGMSRISGKWLVNKRD